MIFLKNILLLTILCFVSQSLLSQDTSSTAGLFEGKVTYIYQVLNPNKALISDEEFYRDMRNAGKSFVTLYIKANQYKWEYEDRIEFYNPKTQQLAIISKRKEDSIYYTPASFVEEKVEKIVKSNLTKTLIGYSLIAQEIHTKWDTKTFFYSSLALKTNPSFWKNHKYNHLSDMTSIGKSFPMIIHQQSLLGNWIMAATKIEDMKIDDTIFNITSSK
jgi:hypothetical protein